MVACGAKHPRRKIKPLNYLI
ncbi:hypothetical protein BRAS3809_3510005 [Bradyrhizobium sp. STM 3809]|nr:hypothetical protein BRAS3809_3510005 [Bradyrhizobium sp. STM 3809]